MVTRAKLAIWKLGLKVKDLAKGLDITEGYLSAIINGRVRPSNKLLVALAELLGVDPEKVLEDVAFSEDRQQMHSGTR